MPKISDIEETPNPNAVKFILREAVSNGTVHQYGSVEQVENDPLAKALFDVGHVVSVFYMDKMITIEKDDEGDWDDLLPVLAVPIRAAHAVVAYVLWSVLVWLSVRAECWGAVVQSAEASPREIIGGVARVSQG